MPFSFANLPIAEHLSVIREALENNNRLILQAPPGAGKTTAVPLALSDAPWLLDKKILMLEPRRLAARSAAIRMAELLGEEVGERIGYHVRGDKKSGPTTRILVITEGILTRYLQNDPSLEDTALVIFDEFHERHLHSDLSLAFALQSQELLRDDLKILVMSATLDTHGLSELLEDAPILTSEGRSYPITLSYRPPSAPPVDSRSLVSELFRTIQGSLNVDEGDILVFLPGEREIRDLESRLRELPDSQDILITPLYGNLTKEEQHRAILPAPQRKIVLATNIAETSLTIEGIRIVIDSGLERVARFDPSSGMERLMTQKISRASADQRAGRAGRTSEGKCYRLWSEPSHHSLAPHRDPEILLADLTPLALELAAWGAEAEDLHWIDSPHRANLSHAHELLEDLGAIEGRAISSHGHTLLRLGLHPRLGHMVLRGRDEGYESEAVLLAALLSDRDILRSDERHTDIRERFWMLKNALIGGKKPPYLFMVLQSVRDISSRMHLKLSFASDMGDDVPGLILSFAYPDRIAHSRGNGRFLTSGGKEVFLEASDDLSREEWLVIAQSDGDTTSARIRLCAPVLEQTLREHHPEAFRVEKKVEWNRDLRRSEAREVERLGAIVLSARPIGNADPEELKMALLGGIRFHGLEALEWRDAVRRLQQRLIALHHHRSDLCPDGFTDEALLESLESWLLPHLGSQRSLEECKSLDWETIILAFLPWETQQELERLLPSHFTAPTQSQIPIDYSDPDAPVLAVRIQEMFGSSEHPCVMEGRLPLSLHLLSPAQRPIQVTRDLVGFWNGSYADVKKDLKGRYPKHYWPDDPATAQATKKTKKFMES